ncbi:MAG: hypothetical protein A3H39_03590 [candidate division NC10 bacterium RIFCSPLOWO2_02_FULL_66_22]|nr:MAG: hypothetical protein A3H39_03590 [candidate division NC10 bacterium RIFCSPLOWO2_02_FULL_66_22]
MDCGNNAACAETRSAAFGSSLSSALPRFLRASTRKLQALLTRRLDGYDCVALFLGRKKFAEDTMVTALGITLQGTRCPSASS